MYAQRWRRPVVFVVLLTLLLPVMGCGILQRQLSPQPQPEAPQPAASPRTAATAMPAGAAVVPSEAAAPATTSAAPGQSLPASDLQSRIGESANRVLSLDEKVLQSYHLQLNSTEPQWNATKKQVETKTVAVTADVAGDDMHLIYTVTNPGQAAQTTEGYMIKGGTAKVEAGGKEYEITDGQLKESIGAVSLIWAFLPLNVTLPLSIGAAGNANAQGQETLDGRVADKYVVDSATAPPGVIDALSGLLSITHANATVWLDQETGALLKLVLDYDQKMIDPPGSGTVVGQGTGHVEMAVTAVGKTTVKLPQ